MKNKVIYSILVLEALLCVVAAALPMTQPGGFAGAMAFPFEQIGAGLRALSVSGAAGNIVAIILYALVCLSPIGMLLYRKPRSFCPEDGLVGLLVLTLFWVIYLMVNPSYIALADGAAEGLDVAKAFLGGTVYSVLAGYLILRMVRVSCAGGGEKINRYLYGLLALLSMLLVAAIFGAGVRQMLASFAQMGQSNSANPRLYGINGVFIVLRFLADALPRALNIGVVFGAMSFLQCRGQEPYSAQSAAAAQRLTKLCRVALAGAVTGPMAFNLLQLLFARKLFWVSSTLEIPLLSIVLVLACLLVARFVAESKTLKDDNDRII